MSNENLPVTLDAAGVVIDAAPTDLLGSDPAARLEQSRKIADLLAPVVRDRGLSSKIQGREYVRFEGWTLLGSLLGVFPMTEWVHEVENGYEARVVARTLGGALVGAAHARCTRDERNWRDRDDFALASMAQTRAGAKALRMPLGFVVQLAGYEATPAEEMESEGGGGRTQEDQGGSRPTAPLATEKQRKLIWARAKGKGDALGLGDEDVANALKQVCADLGFASRSQITAASVDAILHAIEGWTLASFGEPEPEQVESGDAF